MSSATWCSPDQPGCTFDTTVPSSSPTPSSPPSTGGFWSDLTNLAGSLGSVASNIYRSTITPTSQFSPSATPSSPYPVVSNGQVIGYSSTPTAPINSATSNTGNLLLIGLLAFGAILLLRR